MPITTRYRCRNCGARFETPVLTPEEIQEARRRGEIMSAVHCPQCNRTDVERDR
jgi:DNA-directed RNA polymerase subunit RPC12/RpoP